ncbi:hypothetical protein [Oceanobacillus saliphilus]|uniref:hypothetical protein n=1 Tax=Oceanobacillus saliphilus TaxID=2925834 RepID=UPI00201DF68E|nr:hypothetical protein [Oceanobacillus saliphilus]
MGHQSLTIEEFNEKLKTWTGKNIKITKKELHDFDETVMELKSVSYANHTRRMDDYVPEHSLLLNGEGEIENEDNQMEPLPTPLYEIPLDEAANYGFDGSSFSLDTERAVYTIEEQ